MAGDRCSYVPKESEVFCLDVTVARKVISVELVIVGNSLNQHFLPTDTWVYPLNIT